MGELLIQHLIVNSMAKKITEISIKMVVEAIEKDCKEAINYSKTAFHPAMAQGYMQSTLEKILEKIQIIKP